MLHYATARRAAVRGDPALYTYRPHCALVGRYQSLEAELDTHACARLEIEIGRRPTGGGAIIMGPQQLGVAITRERPRDRRAGSHAGVRRRDPAWPREPRRRRPFPRQDDLEVGGRKIAGLGIYADDAGVCSSTAACSPASTSR